jgi:DNA-binding LacI/PurR family transcriptional regulator
MRRFELLETLRNYFDDSELRDICFSLNVDYQSLPGASKGDKARELITFLERRERISELVETCRQLRPNIPWREAGTTADPGSEPLQHLKHRRVLGLCPLFGASKVYYSELLEAILERADSYKYQLIIQPVDMKNKKPLHEYHSMKELDGIIAITCQIEDTSWLEECATARIPVVLIHDNISEAKLKGTTTVSSIRPGLHGLDELVDHLVIDHHCRNICVVMVREKGHLIRQQKLDTIKNAIKRNHLSFDERTQLFYVNEYSYIEGHRIVNYILQTNSTADAVVALADVTAISIMHELRSRGKAHIRVTGFDNIEIAKLFNLTSVDQQLTMIGQTAFQDLDSAIENGRVSFEGHKGIPTVLDKRASCCSPNITFERKTTYRITKA